MNKEKQLKALISGTTSFSWNKKFNGGTRKNTTEKGIYKNTKFNPEDAMLIPYSTVVGELVANIRHVERHGLHRIKFNN